MLRIRKTQFLSLVTLLVLGSSLVGLRPVIADDGPTYTLTAIKGRYGFFFDGQIVGVGPVAAVGYIRSDGKGNIYEAERTITVLGSATTETFTCTYTISPNGKGSAQCPLDNPAPGFPTVETFDYVVEENGKAFRIVATTPGIVITGTGHR